MKIGTTIQLITSSTRLSGKVLKELPYASSITCLEQVIRRLKKEHVTPYTSRNPQKYKINIVKAPKELYAPDISVTLDTEEDYALLCAAFDYLYPKNKYLIP